MICLFNCVSDAQSQPQPQRWRSTSLPARPSLLMKIQRTQQFSAVAAVAVREFSDAGDFTEAGFDQPQQQLSIPVVMPTVSPSKSPAKSPERVGRRAKFIAAGGVSGAALEMWPQATVNIEWLGRIVWGVDASFAKFKAFDTREDLHDILNLVNI